jgi:tetracycline repressor-like protein
VIEVYKGAAAYIGPRVGAQSGARGRLRAYIEAHVEYISQHLSQMMALAEIGLNARDADRSPPLGLTDEPALDPLIRLLRRGQEAGEFREFDARVVAIAIRRAIDGTPRLLISHPEVEVGHYTRELVTLFDFATRQGMTEA